MAETVLVDADDVGAAEAALSTFYSSMRLMKAPENAPSRTRVFRRQIGPLTIDDAEFTFRLAADMDPIDAVMICRVRSGVLGGHLPGHDLELHGAGSVIAFGGRAGQRIAGHIDRARYDVVMIDRALLSEVSAQGTECDGEPVALLSMSPVSAEANRHLADTLSHVRIGVGSNPYALEQPLVTGPLARYVAGCVLAAFPNTATATDDQDIRDTGQELLERAIAFVDDHPDTDVSVADIAAAARVAPSAVHAMFTKHLNCTPMDYVRRVRLYHAHRDLERSDPGKTTVAEVAARWGFGVLEAFEVSYRGRYGVDPIHTLIA
ncbi:helix-turn-helix domain-containing protein [Mycobacterium sp. SMC-4]|uniref:helix-turn-helix domain-containing protein n=1 Tax=Mycobacterium sp. SMC-4 TaxID=2857059 RepID=UPI003D06D783